MSNPLCSRCNGRIHAKEVIFEYFCLSFDKGEEPVVNFSSVDEQMPIALEAAFHWVGRESAEEEAEAKFTISNPPSEASSRIYKYKRIMVFFIKNSTPEGIDGSGRAWRDNDWNVNHDKSTFFHRNIRFDEKSKITITGWQSGEGKFSFHFKRGKSLASNTVAC